MKLLYFKIPINFDLSKNRRMMKYGDYLRESFKYKRIKTHITNMIKKKNKNKFESRKIFVTIFVFFQQQRGDAHNFIEGVCDGVRDGIGVDDRYYTTICDWRIDPVDPRIEVIISQEE